MANARHVADLRTLDRPEWLAVRRRGIGGSDAAAILGWSDWTSPWEAYLDKAGLLDDLDDDSNEAQEWGTRLEAVIADVYAERTGLTLLNPQATYQHAAPDLGFMLASPDRLIVHPDRTDVGLLEVKNVTTWKAEEWADGQVPAAYLIQWQHTAEVMGCTWGAFAALIGGNRLVTVVMERDDDLVKMLIAEEQAFWQRVTDRNPPPIDGQESTEELLKRLFDSAAPDTAVGLDEDLLDELVAYHAAHAAVKDAEEQKRQATNRLRAALGDAEAGLTGDGTRVVTWKQGTRKAFDVEQLKAEMPEIAEKFTRTTVTRTLRPSRSKAALAALGLADTDD